MRAAFYECDITPPLGGFMWGYYKAEIAEDVFERLYAKAAVVESNGCIIAFLSVDTCVVPPEMNEIVTKRIYEYTGIEAANICICSNHTHRGAPVFDSPEINCFADAAYKDVFFRLAADAVILAYKRIDDAEAKFERGEIQGIAFNRDYILDDGKAVTFCHEGAKKTLAGIDKDISVLYFEQDGEPCGALINYACHQDTTGGVNGYSGDYASVLSEKLKEKFGKDFVSLFLLGACGDINHVNPEKKPPKFFHREIGQKLAQKAIELINKSQKIDGCVAVTKEKLVIKRRVADNAYVQEEAARLFKEASIMRARNLTYYHAANKQKNTELLVQVMRIGELCLFALPGEIYVNIGLEIKGQSPFEKNMLIENCNNYCGYIPTKEAFCDKFDLYETSLCFHSCHVPEAGELISQKALEMAKRLLRSMC